MAPDLSSKCEQQAIELDQLKKAKEDLIGKLQAQRFVVSELAQRGTAELWLRLWWGGGGGGGRSRRGKVGSRVVVSTKGKEDL